MGETSHHRKKRKRINHDKKFTVGEIVEVKSDEDGFQGSWHVGKVTACKVGRRVVKYEHILDDDEELLTDTIKVSGVIDGIANECEILYKSRIRPPPPASELVEDDLHYGICVDSCINDAWWEGVVFDCDDGSDCRNIFFPDLGDMAKIELKSMRITRDWDEVTEEWTPRSKWLFLEIIDKYEHNNLIPVSTRQIWYDLRAREEIGELGEWFLPVNVPLWEQLIVEVIDEYLRLSAEQFLTVFDVLEVKSTPEANSPNVHELVPLIDNDLQDDGLITKNKNQATAEANSAYVYDIDLQNDGLMMENENQVIVERELEKIDSSAEPMALSIRPPHTNPSLIVKFKLGEKSKSGRKSRECNYNSTWKPFAAKNDLNPVFCPESVDEYHNSEDKPTPDMTKKIRQHLLFTGWRMESTMCGRQHRVRYFSPTGKIFYNPRDVVTFLVSERDNSSDMAVDSRRMMVTSHNSLNFGDLDCSKPSDKLESGDVLSMERQREVEGECLDRSVADKYCPKFVIEYLKSFNKPYTTSLVGNMKVLTDDTRMHLSALGWRMRLRGKSTKNAEWSYKSPTSKRIYNSLKKVCKAIKLGIEVNTRDPSSSNAEDGAFIEGHKDLLGFRRTHSKKRYFLRKLRNHKRKQNSHSLPSSAPFNHDKGDLEAADELNNEGRALVSSFISKRKALIKVKSSTDGHNSTRMLRSSKRVRQVGPVSSSQLPRTVLSWLIENNAVVPRSKVFYYKGSSPLPLAEGRIASDGIRCNCCQKLFTLSSFQDHAAGNNTHRPAENIFLEDGKSLVSCQVDLMRKKVMSFSREPVKRVKGTRTEAWNDHICSICHYGGELILCDNCPSSFHANCLNLLHVPEGDWFCPSCCCGVCGKSQLNMNAEQLTDESILCCHQCERQYHAHCKKDRDVNPGENWFCCKTCEKMHWGLQQLLGKPILVGSDNLTWTLVKPMDYQTLDHEECDLVALAENYSKLSVALEVMHECFEPVKEPRTKRDLVEDVLFCRGSNLNRLNFKGFYTVLLERNDELITVALLRVYGDKVAEIPLIGTRFQHRRLGMCRVLINEIEKNLMNLGVQKLVLPAAASVVHTWIHSFGFSRVTEADRSGFLGYTFLDFQDTFMCQKPLRKLPLAPLLSRDMSGIHHQARRTVEGSNSIVDHEGNSSMSEVFQEDQREGSETVDQGVQLNGSEEKPNGSDNNPDAPSTTVMAMVTSNQEGEQPCNSSELTGRKMVVRNKNDGNLQYYKRKKGVEARPPATRTNYSKVEVSCR